MNISLPPALERFARQQAKARGLRSVSKYIEALLEREWRGQFGLRLDAGERAEIKRLLREGARVNAKRDRLLAEEWFDLEEEAYGKSRSSRSKAG
jgi:hypothetical protein